MRSIKCKCCGKELNRDNAFKVVVNDKNTYYCNETEFNSIQHKKEIKDKTYQAIFELFGHKVVNTVLYKEINSIADIFTFDKIYSYLLSEKFQLEKSLHKPFSSEYAKIKYLAAILKNNISEQEFETQNEVVINMDYELSFNNFKPKRRKKSLDDYVNEEDDEI